MAAVRWVAGKQQKKQAGHRCSKKQQQARANANSNKGGGKEGRRAFASFLFLYAGIRENRSNEGAGAAGSNNKPERKQVETRPESKRNTNSCTLGAGFSSRQQRQPCTKTIASACDARRIAASNADYRNTATGYATARSEPTLVSRIFWDTLIFWFLTR